MLPIELQDVIIDELAQNPVDKIQLMKCSFVCKQWRRRSYTHLFAVVRMLHTSVEALYNLLANPFSSSGIIPRGRRIHVVGRICPQRGPLPWEQRQINALNAVLDGFTQSGNLDVLSLEKLCWPILDHGTKSLLTRFQSITSLEIVATVFPDYAQLKGFVAEFHSLRSALFQDVHFLIGGVLEVEGDGLQLGRDAGEGSCSSLALRSCGPLLRRDLKWEGESPLSLAARHHVSQLGAQTSNIYDASSLIRSLGPYLHRLSINTGLDIAADDMIGALDLSLSTSLYHLRMSCPQRVLGIISWLPAVLDKITSPSLRILEIAFSSSRQFHLDQPFLQHLAKLLSRPQFDGLETLDFVAFNCRGYAEREEVEGCIRRVMKKWDEMSTLTVSFPG